ncbi:hypothetical protein [Levyella massiliensis]|uniref:hypothetical protein n=1 Tax=Levyella massiliensis TaxID=938289 RepID=UPI0012B51908|nr:hypothetical protein [Levyella massiliensis]
MNHKNPIVVDAIAHVRVSLENSLWKHITNLLNCFYHTPVCSVPQWHYADAKQGILPIDAREVVGWFLRFQQNIHSTIWGTVQSAKSHRKVGGGITAAKEENAKSRRKVGGGITAAKRKSAESHRKVGRIITAAKRKSAESRRKVGGGITAVKRKTAKSRRKVGGIFTAVKCKSAKSRRKAG